MPLSSLGNPGSFTPMCRQSAILSEAGCGHRKNNTSSSILFSREVPRKRYICLPCTDEWLASFVAPSLSVSIVLQYLQLARTLKYYGFNQFKPCFTDFPHPNCRVIVSAGNKELNFRIQLSHVGAKVQIFPRCEQMGIWQILLIWFQEDVKEVSFKVTRMRCWRISTIVSPWYHPFFSDFLIVQSCGLCMP